MASKKPGGCPGICETVLTGPKARSCTQPARRGTPIGEHLKLVLSIIRPAGALNWSRIMFAVVVVLLNALSFGSLAYVANRKGQHTMAALLAAGAWLFGVTAVLIWVWR